MTFKVPLGVMNYLRFTRCFVFIGNNLLPAFSKLFLFVIDLHWLFMITKSPWLLIVFLSVCGSYIYRTLVLPWFSFVFAGSTDTHLLARICTYYTQTVNSSGTNMLIRFTSDSSFTGSGFSVSYKAVFKYGTRNWLD